MSRTRAVTVVSPGGKAISDPTPGLLQNWTVLSFDTKPSTCWNASRVHARPLAVRASNRQLRSLIALLSACDPPKPCELTAGTPPMFGGGPLSHTAVLPLPSGRETSNWASGSTLGSLGSERNVTVPTSRLLTPGLA